MTKRRIAQNPALWAPYGGKPAATAVDIESGKLDAIDFSSTEARVDDYLKSIQGGTVTGRYISEPHTIVPTPRWSKQKYLLTEVIQQEDQFIRGTTGWMRTARTNLLALDRVDLMRRYVSFLADHQSPLAQQVQQILDEMTHKGNKRHRKPLREQAWNLCVGDASLRLPEFKP